MKIEHEKAGVVVTRYGTLAAALAVASGKHHLHNLSSLVMRKLNLEKGRGGGGGGEHDALGLAPMRRYGARDGDRTIVQ